MKETLYTCESLNLNPFFSFLQLNGILSSTYGPRFNKSTVNSFRLVISKLYFPIENMIQYCNYPIFLYVFKCHVVICNFFVCFCLQPRFWDCGERLPAFQQCSWDFSRFTETHTGLCCINNRNPHPSKPLFHRCDRCVGISVWNITAKRFTVPLNVCSIAMRHVEAFMSGISQLNSPSLPPSLSLSVFQH